MTRSVSADGHERLAQFNRDFAARGRRSRLVALLSWTLFVGALIGSAALSQFSLGQLASGLPDAWRYVAATFPTLRADHLGADLQNWYWGLPTWLELLAETTMMAFMGTAFGTMAALLLCFPASSNLTSNRAVSFGARRLLELARTVPDLVFAMIFVFAFGIGPLAGVLALSVHTTGALGKLFSEINESVDRRPIDSVAAAGGSWPIVMRFAVLPQVLPNFVSYALLRFEYNIRSASVFGIVGAGGIGEELYLSIRRFDYPDISAIVILIILVVMAADLICESVRHRMIGRDAMRVGLA